MVDLGQGVARREIQGRALALAGDVAVEDPGAEGLRLGAQRVGIGSSPR